MWHNREPVMNGGGVRNSWLGIFSALPEVAFLYFFSVPVMISYQCLGITVGRGLILGISHIRTQMRSFNGGRDPFATGYPPQAPRETCTHREKHSSSAPLPVDCHRPSGNTIIVQRPAAAWPCGQAIRSLIKLSTRYTALIPETETSIQLCGRENRLDLYR